MIHINHINKYYKKKQVLFDFSLNVVTNKAQIYGLLGPNGAGKTTIIKIVTGLLDYTEGSIIVDEINNYRKWCKENIVYIPAGDRGIRYKNTVYDNVFVFAAMKGIPEKKIKGVLYKYAELLNYSSFLKRRVETLSLGEKKKAMLLCGLCTDVSVIIMDEPSNGLDIDAQIELKSLIRLLSLSLNKTFIISSHDLDFLSDMADRYVFIFQGKNICEIDDKMQTSKIREEYKKIKEKFGS